MKPIIPEALEQYAAEHSHPTSALLRELEDYTKEHCAHPQMLTGALEGAVLRMLAQLIGAKRILEIGLFTGYSALTMAEELPDDGELISLEVDADRAAIARSFLDRSAHGRKIEIRLGPALASLNDLIGPFDMVFIDADKESYCDYYQGVLPLLRPGGLLVVDNALWSGRVLKPATETDHAVVRMNEMIQQDSRVDNVLLPVRDGIMLARKK